MAVSLTESTSAQFTTADAVLAAGAIGQESDTGRVKIGDGSTAWTDLDYFVGDDRLEQLVGLATAAEAIAASSGGGAAAFRNTYTGTAAGVADHTFTRLPFSAAQDDSGTGVLDLTDPTQPLTLTAGIYAVTATVRALGAPAAGTTCSIEIDFDEEGVDWPSASTTAPLDGASGRYASITAIYYMPAGAVLQVGVVHDDDSQTLSFELTASVQRIG